MTDWVVAVIGMLLVLTVVRNVFHTLFHPLSQGGIAPPVMKLVWRLLRVFRRDRRIATFTGPLGIALVIVSWGTLAVLGWAMLYFTALPDGVAYGSELNPGERGAVLDSLYLSLVTIATLGFGDIVPTSPWLRIMIPLEALFGFMLFTAAVSWVLQIYPALHRRRVLALHLTNLTAARKAQPDLGIDSVPTDVLTGITHAVIEARNDLNQYGETYYFRDLERGAALPIALSHAIRLADEAAAAEGPSTRVVGAMLAAALDDLTGLLDREFLHTGGNTAAVVKAYAADHRQPGC